MSDVLEEIRRLINQYPRCLECSFNKNGYCSLPIIKYDKLSEIVVVCPKDKVMLKIKKLLGEEKKNEVNIAFMRD